MVDLFLSRTEDVKEQIGDAVLRHGRLPTAQLREVELRHPVIVAEARWLALARCGPRPARLAIAEQFMRTLYEGLCSVGADVTVVVEPLDQSDRTIRSRSSAPDT